MGGVTRERALQVVWTIFTAKVVAAGIACLSNPCLHGICIDDVNSTYSCYCVDGYTGVLCQTNWDECWSDPCENGGTCIDGIASYNCSCPDGFIGDNCETNYNECESNPCQNNGTCIDMTNGYICSCVPGFIGDHCEVDIAVCNSSGEVRCYNGGQCIEGPGFKFHCRCSPGWAGPHCEEAVDECESNPCQHGGVCIDVHADYMCACTFGYTGKSCEVQIEFCDDNSCSKNAICVVEEDMRICYCVPDYHGERCELQYDECLLGPGCMNGGTCIDGVDNFTCSCPPRLTGSLCECLILDNGSYNCEYVSPTPLPATTQSVLLTTMHDEWTTTEIVSLSSMAYNNDSIIRVSTSSTIDMGKTTSTESRTTSEADSNVLTGIGVTVPTFVTESPHDLITGETRETTMKTKVSVSETKTTETTGSETITECGESCVRSSTDSIAEAPVTLKPDLGNATTIVSSTSGLELTTPKKYTTEPNILSELPTTEAIEQDVPTSPKIDTTTEKLFTESPTEHSLPDATLTPFFTSPATTEGLEIATTIFDNTTSISTTVQTECSESACNNHGTCINTPHGIRCHCTFNYGGRFCDEKISISSAAFGGNSFVAHRLRNTTSIAVEFNAKTLITDGQIMFVDIAKGVYMQLYMNSGLLKFKFSCGYQTMLLSELKTFVNKGYSMKIETRLDLDLKKQHCNATLRLNDTVAMSGGQVANITSLNHNTTLYLGNTPNGKDAENRPFIGCIKDLTVNGERREVFGDSFAAGEVSECSSLSCLSGPCLNGGSCSDHESSYACSCTNGWMGDHCERSACDHNPCQYGGSCVRHPGSGFLCLCPYGKHGIFCEYNVEITRPSIAPLSAGISSYLMYPLSPSAMNTERFDLRLRFQTSDMDQIALLAFVGQNGHHDARSHHLALTFVKGYIMLTWNMGSGPRRIFTPRPLSERRGGHTIRVGRRGRTSWLSVDSRFNVSGNAPGSDTKMTVIPYIYVGGHPSEGFFDLPHDLPLHSGYQGCIWDVGGAAISGGKAAGGRGVGQCGVQQCSAKSCNAPRGVCIHSPATYGCICNEGWFGATCSAPQNPCDVTHTQCRGRCVITAGPEAHCDCPYGTIGVNCEKELFPTDVLFTGVRSYVRLHPHVISSVSLSFEADMKPAKARGLVLFAQTPHFYTALSLQGGLLEYRWIDRLSGVTSLVRSSVIVSMSQWHSVKAGRYGSRIYVWVDGAMSTDAMLAHAYPHTASNSSILLGGAKDLSTLPFDAMSGSPEYYTGCIRNLHVNNVPLLLEKQNIEEGQNLGDCDGTPCGTETCGGGTCVVEDGHARCSCDSQGQDMSGARCRRDVPCRPSDCAPPGGKCRKGSCVCNAGFGGLNCRQMIYVTLPQFSGESLISLYRKASTTDGHVGEQRIGLVTTRPNYIKFNFTTAEPQGLLLWGSMDKDYLGLGLEDGYLKLIWSFHQENASYEVLGDSDTKVLETSRIVNRILPHAGFLADGEWHIVVLRLEKVNVSLVVDQLIAYAEEPGLSGTAEYDTVDLYFGGISERESLAKQVFPHNFKGCIDDITGSEDEATVMNYTELYSENIRSCQLFP